jgi:hypothetical protein
MADRGDHLIPQALSRAGARPDAGLVPSGARRSNREQFYGQDVAGCQKVTPNLPGG